MGGWSGWPFMDDTQYKIYHQYQEVKDPSKVFTFIEMPPNSINAGNFRVPPVLKGKKRAFSMDWPGVYHNNGSVVSFVDSHVEFKRWLEEDTKNKPNHLMNPTTERTIYVSDQNRDLKWLGARTTEPDSNNHKWYSVMGGIGRYNRGWNIKEVDGKSYDSWGWYWNDSWGNHPTWKPYHE